MNIYQYLLEKLKADGTVHMTLLDPAEQSSEKAAEIAEEAVAGGTDALMVGGSVGVAGDVLDQTLQNIKEITNLPIILFPSNVYGLSKHADAVFFMSLLNSKNPYYITGVQAEGAPIVKKLGIEPIPLSYIIIEPGGAAGQVGEANLIPRNKPGLAASYALAGQYLGSKLIYLEAGSGAPKPVPPKMVEETKATINIPLVVGGGIREGNTATKLVRAGADILVTGTIVEEAIDIQKKIDEITTKIKKISRQK